MAAGRKRSGRQGGSGASAGFNFQDRLAAAIACDLLAETASIPRWGWPEDTTLESVHLETGEPVDDLRVINSANSSAYVQAKLSLNLSTSPNSELAKALTAFVNQYLD